MKLSDQIRRAIRDSGKSRYRIAQQANVHQSQLSRFVSGKALVRMETLDRVAEVLNLEISVRESPSEPNREE